MKLATTHIHFVGIGGIGMSGIALVLKRMGYVVSGCDATVNQKSIHQLTQLGIPVYSGNGSPACFDSSITHVVHTTGVNRTHPELQAAAQRNILIHRSSMLATLMRAKTSIAISGSHGKTTTASLIAHLLMQAKLDPSFVIGGYLNDYHTNARLGSGALFVAEADESDRSFLNLPCVFAVVTNIDREHLDVYTDINDVQATFNQFLSSILPGGKVFICADDLYTHTLCVPPTVERITYGLAKDADIQATNIQLYPTHTECAVYAKKISNKAIPMRIGLPGRHNIVNSLAALAVAQELAIPLSTSVQALEYFSGVERRFTFRGMFKGAEVFDDYGHHPREIACALEIARNRAQGRLIVVFQPHRFTRTQSLWDDFINVFVTSDIDQLFITDIYAAHELPIPSVTSSQLVLALQAKRANACVHYVTLDQEFKELRRTLDGAVQKGDLILFLGAGNVYHLAQQITIP